MVNLWHGMPIKRLDPGSNVGRYQTNLSTATSPVHSRHLSETWGVPVERIPVLGLPRNDVLMSKNPSPAAERLRNGEGRRLVVWLPTYRRSVRGQLREDGTDAGNAFQLPGADLAAVTAMAKSWNAHLIVKTHPMAPSEGSVDTPFLSVWDDDDLGTRGLTLYSLLRVADVLITDHSSVWVDFLLLDRPMVFAIADLASYAQTRGFYFTPLEEHLPGRLVESLGELREAVSAEMTVDSGSAVRRAATTLHHVHTDAASARRVIDTVFPGEAGDA